MTRHAMPETAAQQAASAQPVQAAAAQPRDGASTAAASAQPPQGDAPAATASSPPDVDLEIDASGLKCPLPILRAKKGLAQLQAGQVLKVVTTDTHAVRDFQAFASQTGNALLRQDAHADHAVHYLRRRPD